MATETTDTRKPYFDGRTGELLRPLSRECVEDCSHAGDCDGDVAWWLAELGEDFDFPAKLGRDYLREFGAWDDDDLADHEANRARVLWIACGDIRENGDWFGLMH